MNTHTTFLHPLKVMDYAHQITEKKTNINKFNDVKYFHAKMKDNRTTIPLQKKANLGFTHIVKNFDC